MNETKERLTFRPETETRKKIEYWYGQDGCRSMNDFIEKAVNFYIGYLEVNDSNTYLPKVLRSIIDGSIGKFEDRMSHLMFKQSVETDMMATLTAHDHELSEETMRRLRANSVRNVKATKGRMRFHDLRHTFATMALQSGVDIRTVSGMLGHADPGFTLRTYTHTNPKMLEEAAATVGQVMAQNI